MPAIRTSMRRIDSAFLFLVVISTTASFATAHAFSSCPIRIVAAFSPGEYTDGVARLIAQRHGDRLKQPDIVEIRAGANGTIGAAFVAKAPGDGRMLLLVQAAYTSNPRCSVIRTEQLTRRPASANHA